MTRFIPLFLTTCALVLGAMPANANSIDSTVIKISVVKNASMEFTGTALSGNRSTITLADIKQKRAINLGTLNINSVVNYDVAFKSANDYHLKDANGTLAEYKIKYDGKNLVLNSTRLNSKKSETGIYEDTLTVVITAP